MASAIDINLPIYGDPTTVSVRENFRIAKTEISALQVGAPFLPLTGGTLSGQIVVSGRVTANELNVANLLAAYSGSVISVVDFDAPNFAAHIADGVQIQNQLRVGGPIVSTSAAGAGQLILTPTATGSGHGMIWRNDGNVVYLLLTDENDAFGPFNDLRPFSVTAATGQVAMYNGLFVQAGLTANNLNISNLFTVNPGLVFSLANFDAPNFLAHIADGVQIHNSLRIYGPITATSGAVITGLVHSDTMQTNGSITVNGVPFANQANFTVLADSRLRQATATYDRGLDAVRQLQPIAFEYTGNGGTLDDGKRRCGLDAAAAEAVMPELVGTRMVLMGDSEEPVKTLDSGPLTFALVNAIQELAERLETVEAQLADHVQQLKEAGERRNGSER